MGLLKDDIQHLRKDLDAHIHDVLAHVMHVEEHTKSGE